MIIAFAALHIHEGRIEKQLIRSVLTQDDESIALGNAKTLNEGLVERWVRARFCSLEKRPAGMWALTTGIVVS